MNNSQFVGIIIGVSNASLGILLSLFYKPIGSSMAALGKRLHLDKIYGVKLYEERNARRVILMVGILLILWGVIAFILLSAIARKNS